MTGPGWVADRIGARLLGHAEGVAADGGELAPYIRRYLAEHVGAAGLWDRLGERICVLDGLDPDAVAGEAMRTTGARAGLPAPVLTTMVVHAALPFSGCRGAPPCPCVGGVSARCLRSSPD